MKRRLAVAMGIPIALLLWFVPPVIASPFNSEGEETTVLEDPFGVTAKRMAEHLAIEPELAAAYLNRRPAVGELYNALQTSGSLGFDEMYISYKPTYSLHILSSLDNASTITAFVNRSGFDELLPFIKVRNVQYTMENLTSAIDAMERARLGVDFVAQVNVQDSTVWFSTGSQVDATKLKAAVDSGILRIPAARVDVQPSGLFIRNLNSFGGLDLNNLAGGGECTTGFTVEQSDGSGPTGVLTAGHCPNALELNSGQDLTFQQQIFSGSHDTQWHLTPNYTDQPWVRDGGTSHRVIEFKTSRADQMVGDFVCVSKRNDTVKCGTIQSKNFDPGSGFNATFIRVNGGSTDLTQGGDSGGPWWASFGPGADHAYGTHHGEPVADPNDAVYMAQSYVGAMGLRVMLGTCC